MGGGAEWACLCVCGVVQMTVEEAPLSEDIMWQNMDSNLVASSLRIGLGHVLTLLFTGLFFVPTAFISGTCTHRGPDGIGRRFDLQQQAQSQRTRQGHPGLGN